MSRTMTISSWSASKVTWRWDVGVLAEPGADLRVHPGHRARGVEEAVAVGVLADGDEDLA